MIYLDANVIIRFVEGDAATRAPLEARLRRETAFITSHLTRLECRCRPLRENDRVTLALYDAFFGGQELTLLDITAAVIDRATEIRARDNLRTPDAIHVASAALGGADVLITGDRTLARCTDLPIEII